MTYGRQLRGVIAGARGTRLTTLLLLLLLLLLAEDDIRPGKESARRTSAEGGRARWERTMRERSVLSSPVPVDQHLRALLCAQLSVGVL